MRGGLGLGGRAVECEKRVDEQELGFRREASVGIEVATRTSRGLTTILTTVIIRCFLTSWITFISYREKLFDGMPEGPGAYITRGEDVAKADAHATTRQDLYGCPLFLSV